MKNTRNTEAIAKARKDAKDLHAQIEKLQNQIKPVATMLDGLISEKWAEADLVELDIEHDLEALQDLTRDSFSNGTAYTLRGEWVASFDSHLSVDGFFPDEMVPVIQLKMNYKEKITPALVGGLRRVILATAAGRDEVPVRVWDHDVIDSDGRVAHYLFLKGPDFATAYTKSNYDYDDVQPLAPLTKALSFIVENWWYKGGPVEDEQD